MAFIMGSRVRVPPRSPCKSKAHAISRRLGSRMFSCTPGAHKVTSLRTIVQPKATGRSVHEHVAIVGFEMREHEFTMANEEALSGL